MHVSWLKRLSGWHTSVWHQIEMLYKHIASIAPLASSLDVYFSFPHVHLSSIFTFVEAMHQMINHSRVFSLASAIFHCHHQRTVSSPLWEWERKRRGGGVKGQERWVSSLHDTQRSRGVPPAADGAYLGFSAGLPSGSPWAVAGTSIPLHLSPAEKLCFTAAGTANSRSEFSQDSAGMRFNHTHCMWPSHTYELLFID